MTRRYLDKLLKLIDMEPPTLSMFMIGNDQREPNLDRSKCGNIPLILFIVKQNEYIIAN